MSLSTIEVFVAFWITLISRSLYRKRTERMVWRLRTSCVNLEMVLGSQLYHGLVSWLGHSVSLWETPHPSTWASLLHLILLGLHSPLSSSFLQLKICKMDLTIVFILLSLSTSHVNWFKDMLPKHRCERMGTSGEGIKTVQEQWLKNGNNTFFPSAAHVLSHHHEYQDRLSVTDFELRTLPGTFL